MRFLKTMMPWNNAEFIVMKLCIASAYLLLGSIFRSLVIKYSIVLLIVFIITLIWVLSLWLIKMKKAWNQHG